MPKTSFSKSELNELHRILIDHKMFPLFDIGIYYVIEESRVNCNVYKIIFANRNKQLPVSFISRNDVKIHELRQQLIDYFIKNRRK